MRIWLSGPRILGGLIRPGISFSLSELAKPSRRKRGGLPMPDEGELAPPPKFAEYPLHSRIIAWVIFGFAIWGFISMLGCMISAVNAGTCRYYSDGPDSVTACEDGGLIVRHPDGRVDRYGTPNAGF